MTATFTELQCYKQNCAKSTFCTVFVPDMIIPLCTKHVKEFKKLLAKYLEEV